MRRDPPEGKRARYVLTPAGEALVPLYKEMADWGSQHLFEEGEPRGSWPKSAQANLAE